MSTDNIQIGVRWAHELAEALQRIDFGIVCLTEENRASPWILFEAGALSKTLEQGRVVPYLIDIPRHKLDGPLSQFQAIEADLYGTKHLVEAIAESNPTNKLDPRTLDRVFERWWPDLEHDLQEIQLKYPAPKVRQSDIRIFTSRDISIIELLAAGKNVREIAKTMNMGQGTVAVQIQQIKLKLNASDTKEAIEFAKELEII
jgi:DNA-binding CsgD family transcriptional regulator